MKKPPPCAGSGQESQADLRLPACSKQRTLEKLEVELAVAGDPHPEVTARQLLKLWGVLL